MQLKSIQFRPMSPVLGAEVVDIDLHRPLSGQQQADLRALFDTHHVLLFRGQQIDGDDHVRVLGTFGPVCDVYGTGLHSLVSNVEEAGRLGEMMLPFHRDFDFGAYQPPALSLYGVELAGPPIPTEFVDCVRAVERLPHALRSKLEGRTLLNVDEYDKEAVDPYEGKRFDRQDTAQRPRVDLSGRLCVSRPVLQTHPRTGETLISASELATSHIQGVDRQTSDSLLAELFAFLYSPGNVHSHIWRPGDFIIWDNVAMQHGRRNTSGYKENARRTLRRAMISQKNFKELRAGSEHYHLEADALVASD